jgi:hypothetical protein
MACRTGVVAGFFADEAFAFFLVLGVGGSGEERVMEGGRTWLGGEVGGEVLGEKCWIHNSNLL